jgi:alpha-mannosidase
LTALISETERAPAGSSAAAGSSATVVNWMFVASQAVQWEWLLEDHPHLFDRIQRLVDEGKFVPIGGSYVEFDANVPSGESMIRQFLYGGEFFLKKLGCKSRVFWLPDTFGYSGQLPQICQGFGIPYFLSQKLSWNLFNK